METSFTSVGAFALLGLGLVFGLKQATEVDHVVAVSTMVSEHRNVLRSALFGALWGAGHTASLVIVGVLVLVFSRGSSAGCGQLVGVWRDGSSVLTMDCKQRRGFSVWLLDCGMPMSQPLFLF